MEIVLKLQSTAIYVLLVTILITVILLIVNKKLKEYDPLTEPKGIVLLAMMGVSMMDSLVREKTNDAIADKVAPYFTSIIIYIFVSNIIGLIGWESPTANFSVTVTLAFITCTMIEYYSLKYNGIKNYAKALLEPFAPFLIVNLLSKVSILASLSLRLFANNLSGGVMMTVLYALFALISSIFPIIGKFNFVGVFLCGVLHIYFDLFAGVLQAYLFTVLSVSFIGKELPSKD